VGCALVRDAKQHRAAFALHPDYLEEKQRGLASGEFLSDYSFELSRGFRALKIWMSFEGKRAAKFGRRLIDQNIAQAGYLAQLIREQPELELMAPVPINIVCSRFRVPDDSDGLSKALNTEIMLRLQESGIALPSDTLAHGRHCLRVAITNHRTRREDLENPRSRDAKARP
jgi:glutamate/tyrosine decarboxylase-like PLP-dependent enzyme